MVLRGSLTNPTDIASEARIDAAVLRAIDVAVVGLAGAAYCIAIERRARSSAASRAVAYDRLVQRIESMAVPTPTPHEWCDASGA